MNSGIYSSSKFVASPAACWFCTSVFNWVHCNTVSVLCVFMHSSRSIIHQYDETYHRIIYALSWSHEAPGDTVSVLFMHHNYLLSALSNKWWVALLRYWLLAAYGANPANLMSNISVTGYWLLMGQFLLKNNIKNSHKIRKIWSSIWWSLIIINYNSQIHRGCRFVLGNCSGLVFWATMFWSCAVFLR